MTGHIIISQMFHFVICFFFWELKKETNSTFANINVHLFFWLFFCMIFCYMAGMLDGKIYFRMFHYLYRACYVSKEVHPAIMLINEPMHSGRNNNMMALSKMGMMSFLEYKKIEDAMLEPLPDNLGMSDEEIAVLPDLVRNIKCGGKIETGEPYCLAQKYNKHLCLPRKGMASWHPGL